MLRKTMMTMAAAAIICSALGTGVSFARGGGGGGGGHGGGGFGGGGFGGGGFGGGGVPGD